MATVKTITELFNEMPEAQKNQNFKILSYIKYIASHTNTDITRWDILKAFGSGDGNNLLTDKAKINKIITDKLMNLMEKRGIPEMADVEKIPELTVALENGFKFSLDNRRKELQRSIDREMSHIESYSRDIQERFKKVTETQKLLDNIVNNPEPIIAIKKEIQDVLTKGIWGNPVIRDNHLYLNTPNNIQIFEKNKAAGIDVSLDVGQFAVKMDLINFNFSVIPYKNNIIGGGGNYHPHVNANGHICWGNANDTVIKYQRAFAFGKILELLFVLLSTYNNEAPYVTIHRLKSEQQPFKLIPSHLLHPDKIKDAPASAADHAANYVFRVGDAVEYESNTGGGSSARWDYNDDNGGSGRYVQATVTEVDATRIITRAVTPTGASSIWEWPTSGSERYSADQWQRPGFIRHATR